MNNDDLPHEVQDMDIPKNWLVVDFVNDIHIVPDETIDCFEHDLDWQTCFCSPRIVNKLNVIEGSERPIYVHNLLKEVRA